MESDGIMDDLYECFEPVYENQSDTQTQDEAISVNKPKPVVPPKPKTGSSAKSKKESSEKPNSDSVFDDAEYQNEIPEVPAKYNSDEDIPLQHAPGLPKNEDQNLIQSPKVKYLDYRDQSDYLSASDQPLKHNESVKSRRKSVKCNKRLCLLAVLGMIIIGICGIAIGIAIGIGIERKLLNPILNQGQESLIILPHINESDQLALYITPQHDTAKVEISIESIENGRHRVLPMQFNNSFMVEFEKSMTWTDFVIQHKAIAKEIYSNRKITAILSYAHSDTFFLIHRNRLSTNYTLASITHKKDDGNLCSPMFFIFPIDDSKDQTVYYDKIYAMNSKVSLSKWGNLEKGNMTIVPNRPIGVLTVYECTGQAFSQKCNRSYDQVIPDKYLGKEYLIPLFQVSGNINLSYIIITSVYDDNSIEYNEEEGGLETINLNKGESVKREKTPARVKCSKACSVSVIIQFHVKNVTSIAITSIIPTELFLTGKTYFSVETSTHMGTVVLAIDSREERIHSKISLDKSQMQTKWKKSFDFTHATLEGIDKGTHYIESKGMPYMAYVIGHHENIEFPCGFAHYIGLKELA